MTLHAMYEGDMFAVASFSSPTDAVIVQGCLCAAGIKAVVADANLAQAYSLATAAIGGVRILVSEAERERALSIIADFERGAFALDDQFDVGAAET